ncbi:hypothetical protein cypCar_00047289 [Cyprinus carpio]|nr:hypothetical protein cypCar_00047289 [Cyprinus carpio]
MSRVTADLEYQTLLECNYCYPNEVLDDIRKVSADFPHLQLYVDYYFYPNNDQKKLVYLGGTVPVTYEVFLFVCLCRSWPHTGSSSVQKMSTVQHGASTSSVPQHANNSLPKSTKSQMRLNQASETEMSRVRRSYTQELLDFGITFGAQALEANHQTNPFISPASAPNSNASNVDDIDDLFRSLQLQRAVNMYQLSNRERDVHHAGGAWQDWGGGVHSGLVDEHHKVVVSRLPVGISPSKMKNKLTIFFQRRQNAGGEVLDVKYPAAQPDQAWVLFRQQRGTMAHH